MQLQPLAQAFPHCPHDEASEVRSAHFAPPQSVVPDGQAQAPDAQTEPASVHAWPHVPQFAGSESPFAQKVPQSRLFGAAQAQALEAQMEPGLVHMWPHEPQFAGSDRRSTQAVGPPQLAAPALQTHALPAHVPAPHATLQAPQFSASEVRSTHFQPQTAWPAGHAHWPSTQLAPNAHWFPHAPQAA